MEAPQGRLAFLDLPGQPVESARALFERAVDVEESHPERACALYRQAIAAASTCVDAYTNLGRLLHERERYADAEAAYRTGLMQRTQDETLLFNLALLLEDMQRPHEAAQAYRKVLELDQDNAQAHYNLALLCEAAGLAQEAIRHFAAFRRLRKE